MNDQRAGNGGARDGAGRPKRVFDYKLSKAEAEALDQLIIAGRAAHNRAITQWGLESEPADLNAPIDNAERQATFEMIVAAGLRAEREREERSRALDQQMLDPKQRAEWDELNREIRGVTNGN